MYNNNKLNKMEVMLKAGGIPPALFFLKKIVYIIVLLNVIMASLLFLPIQQGSQKSLIYLNSDNSNQRYSLIQPIKLPAVKEKRQEPKAKKIPPRTFKLKCVVTAYTPNPKENGGSGITKMGNRARPGLVAVDPTVIPMGSRIFIKGYGWCVADDTGGKIRGRRIDVCVASRHTAMRWGRKSIEVTVHPGENKLWRKRHKP